MTKTTQTTFAELHHALSLSFLQADATQGRSIFDYWGDVIKHGALSVHNFMSHLQNLDKNPLTPISRSLFFLERVKNHFIVQNAHTLSSRLLHSYLNALKDCIEKISKSKLTTDAKESVKNRRHIIELLKLPMGISWDDENLAIYLEVIQSLSQINISENTIATLLSLPKDIQWSLGNLETYLTLINAVQENADNLLALLSISARGWNSSSFQAYLRLIEQLKTPHVSADTMVELLLPKAGQAWSMGNFLAKGSSAKELEFYAKRIQTLMNQGASDDKILALLSLKTEAGLTLGHLIAGTKNDALIKKYCTWLTSLAKKGQVGAVVNILESGMESGEAVLHALAKNPRKEVWSMFEVLMKKPSNTQKVFNLFLLKDERGHTMGHYLSHRSDLSIYLELLESLKNNIFQEDFKNLLNISSPHGTTLLHRVASCHSSSLLDKYWTLIDGRLSDTQLLNLLERRNQVGTIGDILIAKHHHDEALGNYLFKLRTLAKRGDADIRCRIQSVVEQEFERNVARLSFEPKNFSHYEFTLRSCCSEETFTEKEKMIGDYRQLARVSVNEMPHIFKKLCNLSDRHSIDRTKSSLERFIDLRKKLHNLKAETGYQVSSQFKSISLKKPFFGLRTSAKNVWNELDAKFLIDAIRMGTFTKKEYVYFVFCKESLKDFILNSQEVENRQKLIEECLDKNTALGQFFHTSRGWLKPSIKRGILGEVYQAATRFTTRSASSESTYSIFTDSTGSIENIPSDLETNSVDSNMNSPVFSKSEENFEEQGISSEAKVTGTQSPCTFFGKGPKRQCDSSLLGLSDSYVVKQG